MRIVTRPDLDGIVCAALLHEAEDITEPVKWAEPNEIQEGRIPLKKGDILANLPFDKRCSLWFDHHFSSRINEPFNGAFELAPSAARVVYKYYQGKFKRDYAELVRETDRIDSADLTLDEVLNPSSNPYFLLYLTIGQNDPEERAYWDLLVGLFRQETIEIIMGNVQVKDRCRRALEQEQQFGNFLKAHTQCIDHVSVTDFRSLPVMPQGNRFLVFSLFPDAVVNMKLLIKGSARKQVVLKLGRSIFNRNCRVNLGMLLRRYGGGGHEGAGSARMPEEDADTTIKEILAVLLKNQPTEDSL